MLPVAISGSQTQIRGVQVTGKVLKAAGFVLGLVALLLPTNPAMGQIRTIDIERRHLVRMITDHQRPYVYAAERGTGGRGNLLFIDTISETLARVIPLATNPTDMTINYAEGRLYVTDWQSGFLRVVDLTTQTELPSLPVLSSMDRVNAGRAGRLVMEDWNQFVSAYIYNSTNANLLAAGTLREGDAEMDATGRYYYHCDNNSSGAVISKWDLSADTWALVRGSDTGHPFGSRNLVVSADGSRLFWRGYYYNSDLIEQGGLGAEIYGTTLHGEWAFSSNRVFNVSTHQAVYTFPFNSTNMVMANGQDKLLVFNRNATNISVIPMALIPASVDLAMQPSPTNGQIVPLPFSRLSWSLTPWASRYDVYLGTNEAEVGLATTNSQLRIASTSDGFVTTFNVSQRGQTWYWRVDSVGFNHSSTGAVWRFETAPISLSPVSATGRTVSGVPYASATVALFTASPAVSWAAAESASWLTVSPSSRTGAANVTLSFDATGLVPGTYSNVVTFASGPAEIQLPVVLEVVPLSLVRLLPDPTRPSRLYAIHSDLTYTNTGLLLQYDTVTERIERSLPLGVEPTDMDIDAAEDALYAINFTANSIMKVNLATFMLSGTRTFPPPGNNGGNQYDIKAGRGNLLYWVDARWAPAIHVMDFSTGSEVGLFDDGEGVGDIALAPDGNTLFAWRQFGWSAGSGNSWVRKLNSSGNNPVWVQNSTVGFGRDPIDSPILVSAVGDRVFRNQYSLAATNLEVVLAMFSNEVVYAISPEADYAFTPDNVFNGRTGVVLYRFPFTASVVAMAGLPEKLFRFNTVSRSLVATPFAAVTNRPPVATNLNLTTVEDTPLDVTLSATDAEGDVITFAMATQPSRGTLTGNLPNLIYRPNSNLFGSDSFAYYAVDLYRTSALATVTINVLPVNDAPTANTQSVVVTRGVARLITLTGSDPENDPLTYQIVEPPQHGTLSGTPPSLTFSNAVGYTGPDSFRFKVNDGQTDSAPATVSITIIPPPCRTAPSGVVGWWRGEGNSYDWVGGNQALAGGSLEYSTGKAGQSFSFDGANARLSVLPSDSLNVNAGSGFTIEMWVAPVGFTTNQPLADWSASAYNRGPYLALSALSNGAGAARLLANIIDTNNGSHLLVSAPIVNTGAWQHVALTFNRVGGLTKLFLNGQVRTQATLGTFQIRSASEFHLGHQPWSGGGYFAGGMDEPAVYNRALSDVELSSLFIADDSGKCATPRIPALVTQPASQTVIEGGSATLSATAIGTGPLAFQWLFNSMSLPGARSPAYSISSATPADAGAYRLVVTNAFGAVTSQVAQLTVGHASAVTNGSFETGDFTGWIVNDIVQPFVAPAVRNAGYSPGYGLFTNSPTDGVFSAVHGFDGAGPGVISIAQDVRVPTGFPVLTFDWRAGWDLLTFPGATQSRVLSVSIGPAGGGALWQTNVLLVAPPMTRTLDTGPRKGSVTLASYAGAPVRISFDAYVPESFTGPAFFQLDNVDIVNVPPMILISIGTLLGRDDAIQLIFDADPVRSYRIEATTNLNNWMPAGTATHLGNGLHQFVEVDVQSHAQRFYRVAWP